MKYKDKELGNTAGEIAQNMVLHMPETLYNPYLMLMIDTGTVTKEFADQILEEIPKATAKAQLESHDLMKSLMGGVVDLEVVTASTGRPYTVIARKGQSKLMVNIAYEPMPVLGPDGKGKIAAMGLAFRSMESPNQPSGVPEFSAFQAREIEGDTLGMLRHKRYEMPICVMPCQDYDFYHHYQSQNVTEQVLAWIKDKITKSGAELTGNDELLKTMIEQQLQGVRHECPIKFKVAADSEAKV